MEERPFVSVKEAAQLLEFHPESVRRLIHLGRLPAIRLHANGNFRIPRTAVLAYVSPKPKPPIRHVPTVADVPQPVVPTTPDVPQQEVDDIPQPPAWDWNAFWRGATLGLGGK